LEPKVIVEARQEVEALLAQVEGRGEGRGERRGEGRAQRGYPHFTYGEEEAGAAAIEVYGDRAHLLLDHALTTPVAFMEVGERRGGYALRGTGEVLAAVAVERVADDRFGRRRFLVRPEPGRADELLHWLRALSDGYALVDTVDLHAKPQGPAVVQPARAAAPPAPPAPSGEAGGEIDLAKPYFVGLPALRRQPRELAGMVRGQRREREFVWEPPPAGPARPTCLYGEHAGRARLVDFAGWKLPVWYRSIGEEHQAVRRHAGLFDVSHMGVLEITGPDAEAFLDWTTTACLPAVLPGQAKYAYLLAPDGQVVDDVMIYRLSRTRFLVVVNAVNAARDEAWWRAAASGEYLLDRDRPEIAFPGRVTIHNLKDPACGDAQRTDLALQGPDALRVLGLVTKDSDFYSEIKELRRFDHAGGELLGAEVLVARTGYTGERLGFEILVHPDAAPLLWRALLQAGEPFGLLPAGLGARDSTRTEAGLPLHGHELAGEHGVDPIEAGYGSFVKLHKPFFVGRPAMLASALRRERQIVRFAAASEPGTRPIRPGHVVVEARKGSLAGRVTSCAFCGDREVGMAIVDSRFAAPQTRLAVFTCTDRDGAPAGKRMSELGPADWLPVSRPAVVLSRFPDPGDPFPRDAGED
ncbi:MAG: aminomethyl transferase family protein, partial [Deltaproteobacteria bacterium]|nr:aminomethyl transferase family protein [Deltaproteobacteria bacterium]